MANVLELEGRTAVVTGGSRGIGFATAAALRSAGANVLICGRSAEALGQAVDLGIQIADALTASHGAGILHLDVRPGTIKLSRR